METGKGRANRKRVATFAIVAMMLTLLSVGLVAAPTFAAGPGGTVGDSVSDGLMGNEPNIIPFEEGDSGPSQEDPGSIGDEGGNSGNPDSVEGSGAPGPITCNGNWFGPGLLGGQDTVIPGNPDAPGMNVDCGTGGSPPHTP